MEEQEQTIKARWNKLNNRRSSVLQRARRCAELTIPSLMPPEGADENTQLPTPYQGLGARGVNNLASKLLLTLLPPNSPFFRFSVDDFVLEQAGQRRAQVEQSLASVERAIMNEIESKAIRVQTNEGLRLLIVTGNALLYIPDEGGMKVYRLDQYVVKRDPMGNVMEIITREVINPRVLPENIRSKVLNDRTNKDEDVELYTRVVRSVDGSLWEVSQECNGVELPDSEGTYPIDESPWIALRWSSLVGEDYGRGLVEEYLGDLATLEALTKAITEGAIQAARVIYMVNPNGSTRIKKLAEARTGDIIEGIADDVTTLQLTKYADFRVALEQCNKIEQRLGYAFMLLQSVQRDAERVTAEEVRRLAKELEDSLGGVYSVLSREFQLPLIRRLMKVTPNLPDLPTDIVKPAIVTGIEALGRGNDLEKLMVFTNTIASFGEAAISRINMEDYLTRVATAIGIDSVGMVKTDEEIAAEQEEMLVAQMGQQALPGMAQEVMKGMMQNGQGQSST